MIYMAHRINTLEELRILPKEYGVELDLRDNIDGSIYIQHNPFEPGEDFEEYLKEYHHGMMIVNIKSERIEEPVMDLLRKYEVKDYFFLDSSFPMVKLLTDKGINDIALRYSELEGIDTIENMAGKVKWIWVDTFTKIPIDKKTEQYMHEMGYKLCFVSPELESQPEKINLYIDEIKITGLHFDAVCSKTAYLGRWKENFGER